MDNPAVPPTEQPKNESMRFASALFDSDVAPKIRAYAELSHRGFATEAANCLANLASSIAGALASIVGRAAAHRFFLELADVCSALDPAPADPTAANDSPSEAARHD